MNESASEQPIDHEKLLRQAIGSGEAAAHSGGAAQPEPPTLDELAPNFPDYELRALVGQGGMAAVYRANHRKLERDVAIKVLDSALASDSEFGERFLREARALAKLNHAHVLTVFDFGEFDGLYFLVTEFVDGVNLRQLMELGELSPAEALRIAPQICEALQYAHEQGVVHRDIKPENILIDSAGQVRIADFGLAKLARPGEKVALTRSTAVFGTPHYMAPEQWRGSGAVDHRADIFSLGVVIYEMLTGQLPIGHFDPPSKRSGVPHGLDEVVKRTLAQQPENRYQQASQVKTDVELQARSVGCGRGPESTPVADPEARLVKLPIVALALVLIGVAGFVALVTIDALASRERHRDHSMIARYESRMQAVLEAPPGAEFVPTDVPVLPVIDLDRTVISDVALKILVGGGAVGLGLLVLLLGFWSLRRVRAAQGRLRGVALSVITAWLLPLAAVDMGLAAPIASMGHGDLRNILLFLAILLIGSLNIAFVVWEIRRQSRLIAARVAPAGSGVGLATGVVFATLVLTGAIATSALWPREPYNVEVAAGPTRPADLVGRTREFVLQRLGPPSEVSCSRASQVWGYRGRDGEVIRGVLTISDGRVVAGLPQIDVVLVNEFPAEGEPYVGQPFEELTVKHGSPISTTQGAMCDEFELADGLRVRVHDGVVISASRR